MTPAERWEEIATLNDALEHGLSEDEFRHIRELLGRNISMLELGISAALYSEHCSYKSTRPLLRSLPTEGERVLQGPGENAGVVDIGDGQAVVFKIESHNHPSYIEPFQGAATGVGGILRDVFTMGARPVALLNALRFGTLEHPRTRSLVQRVVKGIGFYGNCVGVPTVGGELFFDPSFNGNCLVNAFALGMIDSDKIFLGRASGLGNPVIYVGSKTGRDGIRGAIMASEAFADDSDSKRPTVQVGDPFQEKLLIEACLEAMASGVVVGIQDMGAAGLTSSTYEMAARAKSGVRLWLDAIPVRESNMTPYELMLSESQERMLLIAERGKEQVIYDICKRWELDAVQVGEVCEGTSVHLTWHGREVSVLPAELLTDSVPLKRWPEAAPSDYQARREFDILSVPEAPDLSRVWLSMLASLNLCSRAPVYSQYDSTIRANTVVHPGGDAAVIRVPSRGDGPAKGIAMTLDCNSRFCGVDPFLGTAHSVVEAFRNISAVGARPIGISDNLNFGSPERPEGMWQIAQAVRGLGEAARSIKTPIVSGNVSLYNETKGQAVLPSLVVAMVGLLDDVSKACSAHFKRRGDRILLFGATNERDLGCSEYMAHYAEVDRGEPPQLGYEQELRGAELVHELIGAGLLRSCHDLSAGGLAIALCEACFNDYSWSGARLQVDEYQGRSDGPLFAESGARYLVSCDPRHEAALRAAAERHGVPVTASGEVGGEAIEIVGYAALDAREAYQQWRNGLERIWTSQQASSWSAA